MNRDRLISEALRPVADAEPALALTVGEPALPSRFVWRGEEYAIAAVLGRWKESSGCSHGNGEQYVRKHWYEVKMESGAVMKIYFERQARSKQESKRRWWLYTVREPESEMGR